MRSTLQNFLYCIIIIINQALSKVGFKLIMTTHIFQLISTLNRVEKSSTANASSKHSQWQCVLLSNVCSFEINHTTYVFKAHRDVSYMLTPIIQIINNENQKKEKKLKKKTETKVITYDSFVIHQLNLSFFYMVVNHFIFFHFGLQYIRRTVYFRTFNHRWLITKMSPLLVIVGILLPVSLTFYFIYHCH